jgi:hypothetical protein
MLHVADHSMLQKSVRHIGQRLSRNEMAKRERLALVEQLIRVHLKNPIGIVPSTGIQKSRPVLGIIPADI